MQAASHRPLLVTFAGLLLLLIATVVVAFLPLGTGKPWLAMGIAVTKTLLVVSVFMGLNRSTGVTRLAACAGVLWLTIAMTIVLADSLTRGWGETNAPDLRSGEHIKTFDRVDHLE